MQAKRISCVSCDRLMLMRPSAERATPYSSECLLKKKKIIFSLFFILSFFSLHIILSFHNTCTLGATSEQLQQDDTSVCCICREHYGTLLRLKQHFPFRWPPCVAASSCSHNENIGHCPQLASGLKEILLHAA